MRKARLGVCMMGKGDMLPMPHPRRLLIIITLNVNDDPTIGKLLLTQSMFQVIHSDISNQPSVTTLDVCDREITFSSLCTFNSWSRSLCTVFDSSARIMSAGRCMKS